MVAVVASEQMKDEIMTRRYYAGIAFVVCAVPYAWGWPRSWLAALPITLAFFVAMLWLVRSMPLNRNAVKASTPWLVLVFAILMIAHGLIIRELIGLPLLAKGR